LYYQVQEAGVPVAVVAVSASLLLLLLLFPLISRSEVTIRSMLGLK
jgi:hypothetical protein